MKEMLYENKLKTIKFLGKKSEQKEFEGRSIIINTEQLTVRMGGRESSIVGFYLMSKNTTNPKPLEIVVEEGDVFQSDNKTFFIPQGTVSISGEKIFEALEKLKKSKGELKPLPIRDPDITEIDGKTFYQTGTLKVKVTNAFITIE